MLDQLLAVVRAKYPRPPKNVRQAKKWAREISRELPVDGALLLALTYTKRSGRV